MGKLPSEVAAVCAVIDPDANTASSYTSDYVNMEYFESAMAIILAGVLGSSASLSASLLQATSAAGANAKAVSTSHAITALTTASNDKQAIINLRTDDLDVAGGFSFVALKMTVTNSTSDFGGLILGMNPRYGPASDNDLASVAQIVSP